jgi:hypothetical protein
MKLLPHLPGVHGGIFLMNCISSFSNDLTSDFTNRIPENLPLGLMMKETWVLNVVSEMLFVKGVNEILAL